MKMDIYKNMKLNGVRVIYERDTHNVYDADGNFLCVGFLDGNKLIKIEPIDNGVGGVKIDE